MPHRRPVRKGSFGGRLGDLVEHFSEDAPRSRGKLPYKPRAAKPDNRHINDRLFEGAWGSARKASQPARPKQP
jgi:hypothetical protein